MEQEKWTNHKRKESKKVVFWYTLEAVASFYLLYILIRYFL